MSEASPAVFLSYASQDAEAARHVCEAHTALGLVRFHFAWDWKGAEAEFRRGLELSPGSSAAHEECGGGLMAMGRLDEGLARSQEAAKLDPLSLGPAHDLGINAMARGDYDKAVAAFRRTIEIDPNGTWGYIKLARARKQADVLFELQKKRYVDPELAAHPRFQAIVEPMAFPKPGAT